MCLSPSHSFSENAFHNNGYSFNILFKFHACDGDLEKKVQKMHKDVQESFTDYT